MASGFLTMDVTFMWSDSDNWLLIKMSKPLTSFNSVRFHMKCVLNVCLEWDDDDYVNLNMQIS